MDSVTLSVKVTGVWATVYTRTQSRTSCSEQHHFRSSTVSVCALLHFLAGVLEMASIFGTANDEKVAKTPNSTDFEEPISLSALAICVSRTKRYSTDFEAIRGGDFRASPANWWHLVLR
jgi:hypothetical protein